MWARDVELMLGLWLTISPWLFRHAPDESALWINDFLCGSLIAGFAVVSYRKTSRRAHLLTLGVAIWLIAFGYMSAGDPKPPASQNHIVLGLLLLMFAIVPSDANRPPQGWRDAAPLPKDRS
jgi:peptidoglycan/LPS O-acetylase OafA/YrhL